MFSFGHKKIKSTTNNADVVSDTYLKIISYFIIAKTKYKYQKFKYAFPPKKYIHPSTKIKSLVNHNTTAKKKKNVILFSAHLIRIKESKKIYYFIK